MKKLLLIWVCILASYGSDLKIEDLDFNKTFQLESYNKFDSVNRDDVGSMALGIVQFRGIYCKRLKKALGIRNSMTTRQIKKRLRTEYSKKLQIELFKEEFVQPILEFAKDRNITDSKIIEFLVDWRVNGMPKYCYRKINYTTTLKELVQFRNRRYIKLHNKYPQRFTKRILKHWLKRSNSFLA